MAAISNRYKPKHKSANAKWLIRNFGTVTSFLQILKLALLLNIIINRINVFAIPIGN